MRAEERWCLRASSGQQSHGRTQPPPLPPHLNCMQVQPKALGLPVHAYVARDEIREDGTQRSQKARGSGGHRVVSRREGAAGQPAAAPPGTSPRSPHASLPRSKCPLPPTAPATDRLLPPQVFANLPTEVGATEAEEIGVEHLLRDVKDANISTLGSEVRIRGRALTGGAWECTGAAGSAAAVCATLLLPRTPRPTLQVGQMVTGLRGLRARLLEVRTLPGTPLFPPRKLNKTKTKSQILISSAP